MSNGKLLDTLATLIHQESAQVLDTSNLEKLATRVVPLLSHTVQVGDPGAGPSHVNTDAEVQKRKTEKIGKSTPKFDFPDSGSSSTTSSTNANDESSPSNSSSMEEGEKSLKKSRKK